MTSAPVSCAKPVRFAPGRARLATRPSSTGKKEAAITIGIVAVAALGAEDAGIEAGDNYIDAEADEFSRQSGKPVEMPICKAIFDDDVRARHVTPFAQPDLERVDQVRLGISRCPS